MSLSSSFLYQWCWGIWSTNSFHALPCSAGAILHVCECPVVIKWKRTMIPKVDNIYLVQFVIFFWNFILVLKGLKQTMHLTQIKRKLVNNNNLFSKTNDKPPLMLFKRGPMPLSSSNDMNSHTWHMHVLMCSHITQLPSLCLAVNFTLWLGK